MQNLAASPLEIIEINSKISQSFLTDVWDCFSNTTTEKSLPYWWLYDESGSKFFEGAFKN